MHTLPGSAATQWRTQEPAFQHSEWPWQACAVESPLVHGAAQGTPALPSQSPWTEDKQDWTRQRTAQSPVLEQRQDIQAQQAAEQSAWAADVHEGPQGNCRLSLSDAHVQKNPMLRPPAGFNSRRKKTAMDHMERWQHIRNQPRHHNQIRQGSPASSPRSHHEELRVQQPLMDIDEEFNLLPSENWQDAFTPAIQSPPPALRNRLGATGTFRRQQGPPAEQPLFHTRGNDSQPLSKHVQRATGGMPCSDDEDNLASLLQTQGAAPGTSRGCNTKTRRTPQAWGRDAHVSVPSPACRPVCPGLCEWAPTYWMPCMRRPHETTHSSFYTALQRSSILGRITIPEADEMCTTPHIVPHASLVRCYRQHNLLQAYN